MGFQQFFRRYSEVERTWVGNFKMVVIHGNTYGAYSFCRFYVLTGRTFEFHNLRLAAGPPLAIMFFSSVKSMLFIRYLSCKIQGWVKLTTFFK